MDWDAAVDSAVGADHGASGSPENQDRKSGYGIDN